MDTITVDKIRKIFFGRDGLPKKGEHLKDIHEIVDAIGIVIEELSIAEQQYQKNLIRSVLYAVKDSCFEHHIAFQCAKLKNHPYVKYGFSNDPDIMQSTLDRAKQRKIQHTIAYNKVKQIADEYFQAQLDFGE